MTDFDATTFRRITAQVIADEKPGFWSDWTDEQQQLYISGDWRAFSVSRGYTFEQIENYAAWVRMYLHARDTGVDIPTLVGDLLIACALKNHKADRHGEILISSHGPLDEDTLDIRTPVSPAAWASFLSLHGGAV